MKKFFITIVFTLVSFCLSAQSGSTAIDKKKEAIQFYIDSESYDKALSTLFELEKLLGEDDLYILGRKMMLYSYLGDFGEAIVYGHQYFDKDPQEEDTPLIFQFYGFAMIALMQEDFEQVKLENTVDGYQEFLEAYAKIYEMLELSDEDLEYAKNKIEEIPLYSESDVVHHQVDQLPEFPGGSQALNQYIQEEVKYPIEAMTNNIKGRVFVRFVIEKQGIVTGVEVIKGIHPLLDNEAVRVVESFPDFKPGKVEGKIVRVGMILPINFNFE